MSDKSDILSDLQSDHEIKNTFREDILSKDKRKQYQALLNDRITWGKQKQNYHKDQQSSQSGSEDEEAQEIEAEILQKRNLQKYEEDDYWNTFQDEEIQQKNIIQMESGNITDLLNISPEILKKLKNEELINVIYKEWPEVQEMLGQIEKTQAFLKKSINKVTQSGTQYEHFNELKIKQKTTYLVLLLFYLQLRFKTKLQRNHPIFQLILECKATGKALQQTKNHFRFLDEHKKYKKEKKIQNKKEIAIQMNDSTVHQQHAKKQKKQPQYLNIMNELDKEDQQIIKGDGIPFSQESSIPQNPIKKSEEAFDSDDVFDDQDLGFYEENIEKQTQKKKQKKEQKQEQKSKDIEEVNQFFKMKTVGEDDPRKINFIMLKKKSLMQRRRGKRFTNSRVKHKVKFEKAQQKLKTQGKTHKIQKSKFYEGESGLKSTLIRSKKLI